MLDIKLRASCLQAVRDPQTCLSSDHSCVQVILWCLSAFHLENREQEAARDFPLCQVVTFCGALQTQSSSAAPATNPPLCCSFKSCRCVCSVSPRLQVRPAVIQPTCRTATRATGFCSQRSRHGRFGVRMQTSPFHHIVPMCLNRK